VLGALDALVRDGRVRTIGVSNFTAAQLGDLLARQSTLGLMPIRALQNVHNFAVRGFDAPLRELCGPAEIDLIGYSPLGAGFLTGKHRHGVAPGSRFDLVPGHQAIYFTEPSLARLARLEHTAARANFSPAQVALAWALRDPQVRTVLVGGRAAGQLDQALAARALVAHAVFSKLDADPARAMPQGT
jgi:aryl-alcohol dehydrogenase-like predicted oxidoreductase